MRGHQSSESQCHADNDHDLMIVHISPPHVWQQKGVELVDIHRTRYKSSQSLWDHQLLPQQLSSESRRSYL